MFDLDSVRELFKTEPNTAFFWSGLGENGAEIAKEIAKANGGVTLEMLMEQNKQKLIDAGFPYNKDLDDFVFNGSDPENLKAWKDLSKAYASQASGNVRAVLGDNIKPGSVWCTDEMPCLFSTENVTSVQGVSKQQLMDSYKMLRLSDINESDANFALGKAISDVPVNNTDIDYFTKRIASKYNLSPIMDKEIIDKFIAYEHLTSINADSVTISKLGIMSNSELFSKYSFLDSSVSQSVLDEFRIGEYRLKTTGVDTLTNATVYFDVNGRVVSVGNSVSSSVFETTVGDIIQFTPDAEISKFFPDIDFENLSELEKLQLRQFDLEFRRTNNILDSLEVDDAIKSKYLSKIGKTEETAGIFDKWAIRMLDGKFSGSDDAANALTKLASFAKKLPKKIASVIPYVGYIYDLIDVINGMDDIMDAYEIGGQKYAIEVSQIIFGKLALETTETWLVGEFSACIMTIGTCFGPVGLGISIAVALSLNIANMYMLYKFGQSFDENFDVNDFWINPANGDRQWDRMI